MTNGNPRTSSHFQINEQLVFETGSPGRRGYDLPVLDIPEVPLLEILPPSVANFKTLFLFALKVKPVFQVKALPVRLSVFMPTSNPLFSMSPIFCVELVNPEADGSCTLSNKFVLRSL